MKDQRLSELENRFQIERKKFDSISKRIHLDETDVLPPDANYVEYSETESYLLGTGKLLGDLNGKRVLEMGCGTGKLSVLLAKSGATVSAFDISPETIKVARQRAELNNVADRIDFHVCVAEDLPFDDETFDVGFGLAILHHLDVDLASPELHRVLKVGGIAVFSEPLANNRLIRFLRDYVPYSRKPPRGTDHPLTYNDIQAWARLFDECHWQEMHLFGMLERILGWRWQFPRLHEFDRVVLDRFKFLRRYANYAVISLKKLHATPSITGVK